MKINTRISFLAALFLGAFGLSFAPGCAATATRPSTGQYIDDSAITAKVKTALLRDQSTHATEIHVDTYKGVVQLSGFVNTPDEKSRAEELARGVPGVQNVVNNITVKTTSSE